MGKRVVFYDKWTGGHRPFVQGIIRDYLKPSNYTFDIANNPEGENSFAFLRRLAQAERFDHCYLMTLDDCFEEFYNDADVQWFLNAGITFSATIYKFTYLQPHYMLWKAIRYRSPKFLRKARATAKAAGSSILRAIAAPDERIEQGHFLSPWRNKLHLLPDVAAFSNEPSDCQQAKQDYGWTDGRPTILMFGSMYRRKGLDLFMEAISHEFNYHSPFRVILAGHQIDGKADQPLSPGVELIEYNRFIEPEEARKLFAAADCVVLPFEEGWDYSSGTFSLACASGNFVITTDQGVLGWRVRKYQNGNLYRPGSSESMASAIGKFVKQYPELSFPIEGSVGYAATCAPGRYAEIIDSVVKKSLNPVY